MKNILKRAIRDEKGAAMVLALILLLVGGLIVASLLSFMGTGLLVGPVYEGRVAELYGADAGVEDAAWKIQHRADIPTGCAGCTTRSYDITDVNGREVEFSITRANNVTLIYQIVSTATSDDGSSTTVEADVERILGGEFDIFSGFASKGDITFIGHGSSVAGDIYYGGTLDPNGWTHISGNKTPVDPVEDFPSPDEDLAFAEMLKSQAMSGENHTGDMNIESDRTLNSVYISGNLIINKEVTLTINGIVYVKGSVSVKKGVNDYTLGGSGSLIAEGDIDLRKVSGFGASGDSILMSLNGDIYFKKEAYVEALIYAPNGDISFDKTAVVNGGIVGASITVNKDASLTYVQKAGGFDLPGQLPDKVRIKTYSISQN